MAVGKSLRDGIRRLGSSRRSRCLGCRRCGLGRFDCVVRADLADLRADPFLAKAALGVAICDFSNDVVAANIARVWATFLVTSRYTLRRTFAPSAPLAVVGERLSRHLENSFRSRSVDGFCHVFHLVIVVDIEIRIPRVVFGL